MSNRYHKDLIEGDIHRINQFEYANSTERTTDSSLVSTDVGKVAKQTDTDPPTWWLLNNASPIEWQQISMVGGPAGIDDVLSVGQIIDGKNRFIIGNNSALLNKLFYDLTVNDFTSVGEIFIDDNMATIAAATGDGAGLLIAKSSVEISTTAMKVTDDINSKGLEYAADYSGNFVNRSLVDKEYVDLVSQTPFKSNIDGAGFNLTDVGILQADKLEIINPGTGANPAIMSNSANKDFNFSDSNIFFNGGHIDMNGSFISNGSNFQADIFEVINAGAGANPTISSNDANQAFLFTGFANYSSDFSGNFVNRSLVDKAYVDARGIDTVLAVGQIIDGANRTIIGNNNSSLNIGIFDLTLSNFTKAGEIFVDSDAGSISVATGDGAGGTTAESKIQITTSFMRVDDSINLTGLKYNDDYSANFTERSLVDKNYSDFKSLLAQNVQNTGLLSGAIITQNTASSVDISAGVGYITDYMDPENPMTQEVNFPGITNYTPVNIAVDGFFSIGFDENFTIVEDPGAPSNQQLRDNIFVGGVQIISGVIIIISPDPLNLGYNGIQSAKDFITDVIGPANISGNIFTANGVNLQLDNSGGSIYAVGSNFRINTEVPDERVIPSSSPSTFLKVFRLADPSTAVINDGAPTTFINPNLYDDGSGVLQSVPSNDFSVQVVYIVTDTSLVVAYGQEIFNTLADAETALLNGSLLNQEKSPLGGLVRRLFLVIRQGTTDLTNTANAAFFNDGKFRTGGITTGGGTPGVTAPGGPITSVQFNNSGTFGGDAAFVWDGSVLTFSQGIIGEINYSGEGTNENLYIGDVVLPGTIGNSNIVIGFDSVSTVDANTNFNIAIGKNVAPTLHNSSNNNLFVGHDIFDGLTLGTARNIVLGSFPCSALGNASKNQLIGSNTLNLVQSLLESVIIADDSINNAVNCERSVVIGHSIGSGTTGLQDCIVIGHGAAIPDASDIFLLNIGDLIIGDLSAGKVQIGGAVQLPAGSEILNVQGGLVTTGPINTAEFFRSTTSFFWTTSGTTGTGGGNTMIGDGVGDNFTTAFQNTFIGRLAGEAMLTGSVNVKIGVGAGKSNTAGSGNVVIGADAGEMATDLENNVIIGRDAVPGMTSGSGNVILGNATGLNATGVGTNLILIGSGVDIPNAFITNYLNIGGLITGSFADLQVKIGGSVSSFSGDAQLELANVGMALLINRNNNSQEGTITKQNGMIWYNSETGTFRGRQNGANVTFTTS